MTIEYRQKLAALAACAAILTGCSVTPEPFDAEHHADRAKADLEKLRAVEYVPTQPITLKEAIARAVVVNLNRKVLAIEKDIAEVEADRSNLKMLPSFDVKGGRNIQSDRTTSTEDKVIDTRSVGFAWSVLDLGVSYARAKQMADEVLIAREHERKAIQDIIREVRTAYWRAAGAERLVSKVELASKDIVAALKQSRDLESSRGIDVLYSVAYRREILGTVQQVLAIRRELDDAKSTLAQMLNIRPGTDFSLADTKAPTFVPSVSMSLRDMETHALNQRPELRIEDYNERIGEWQEREALYDLLPGLDLNFSQNFNSDSFNLNQKWTSTGIQVGMNLFDLFAGTTNIKAGQKREERAREQRLALSLAVLTQTHLAYSQFHLAEQHLRLAREIAGSDRKLAKLVRADAEYSVVDYFETVRHTTKALQSEIEEYRANVDLISAHSELMHSIGFDAYVDEIPPNDMVAMREVVGLILEGWEKPDNKSVHASEGPIDAMVESILADSNAGGSLQHASILDRDRTGRAIEAGNTVAAVVAPPAVSVNPILSGDKPYAIPKAKPPATEPNVQDRPVAALPAGRREHGFVAQIGAFNNEIRAMLLLNVVTRRNDGAFGDLRLRIVARHDGDGRKVYYVETAIVPDIATARRMCQVIQRQEVACFAASRSSSKSLDSPIGVREQVGSIPRAQ